MIGRTVSHYRILEQLGASELSVVYLAEDTDRHRTVAFKLFFSDATRDPEATSRFLQEARAASALDHPSICTIEKIGKTEDGQLFMVMPCYQGETLKDRLSRGPLRLEEAVDLGSQVADGLARAHEQGLVHREIKPGNIYITDDNQAKVLDFGLASLTGQAQLAETDSNLNNVFYLSPEQAKGQRVDARTDIWSLGAVLYEMVTGLHAVKGEHEQAVFDFILNEECEPVGQLRAGMPRELEQLIHKCLKKAPDQRYQSCGDMQADFKRIKSALAGTARLVGPQKPVFPQKRRAPRAAAVVAGTMFALVAVIFGFNVGNLRDRLTGPSTPTLIASIAVLPLDNLMEDPDQEYFVDGMQEGLIEELAQISALMVISPASARKYEDTEKTVAEIARKLDVDAVVKGSVLRADGSVRLRTQLVEAETDRHLWAETYDRELRDIPILQSEVARAIAHHAGATVTSEEEERLTRKRPVDPEAYEACLRGEYLMEHANVENARRAREYFLQAIAKDPTYAPAYLGLGDSYTMVSATMRPEAKIPATRVPASQKPTTQIPEAKMSDAKTSEAKTPATLVPTTQLPDVEITGAKRETVLPASYPNARAAVTKALELDPNLADAHLLLAEIYFEQDRNWAGAEEEYARALDLQPSDAHARGLYSGFLSAMGRHEEAIEHSRRAVRLDPLSPDAQAQLGYSLYYAQRFDEALGQLARSRDLAPDLSSVHYGFGRVYLKLGRYDEAIAAFEKGDALAESGPSFLTAYALAVAGHREKAIEILRENETDYSKGNIDDADRIAIIYTGLGDKDRAFEWLEKAHDENDPRMEFLKVSPLLEPLRDDARWEELMRNLGLKD